MKRLVLIIACIALAGCGGDREAADEGARGGAKIGTPQIATNDPRGVDLEDVEKEGDVVTGEPELDAFGRRPPVRLGSAQANCSGTRIRPSASNVRYVRRATLCLINAERRARGMRPLRGNAALARAALRHSRDMVRRKYFSHTSRSGRTFVDRIRVTGYLRRARRWTVGENLAWGSSYRATPAQIVRAWMRSPGHRANILNRRFREAGLGIAIGAPRRVAGRSATYSNEFGSRS